MKRRQLGSSQREFLGRVYEAAFANPFGESRARLDISIAGLAGDVEADESLAGAVAEVTAFVAELDSAEAGVLKGFAAEDRLLVKNALLFALFHSCMEQFDALIDRQIKIGDGVCPVSFAGDVLGQMMRHGLSEEESLNAFALFYQLRRAYYFISRSLVGRSSSMQHLRMVLWNNVFTVDPRFYVEHLQDRMEDFSSLILGETGTGKGAAASAIGRSGFIPFNATQNNFSESFMASFVEINLSQFPESLIESELFGHRKGAFTGAVEAHKGTFSLCSPHGAVFLDEIGDVSIPVQIKLLKVLQDRTFSAVGSHEKLRFRGRVIAATNKPIDELRRSGHFRDDFYYRLCSDLIVMPPLRLRIQEDLQELDDLLSVVVRRIVDEDDPETIARIREVLIASVGRDYAWPGNVRELEQSVRRILLCGSYHGQKQPLQTTLDRLQAGINAGSYDAQSLISDYCKHLHALHGTYEAVARITELDRRTAKKHIVR
jgi:DNA-binding NtrC family response regulator